VSELIEIIESNQTDVDRKYETTEAARARPTWSYSLLK